MSKKFVVVDTDNDVTVGPFDSEAEATAYFIHMANQEEWPEVIEAGDFPFENTGLKLEELAEPYAPALAAARAVIQ